VWKAYGAKFSNLLLFRASFVGIGVGFQQSARCPMPSRRCFLVTSAAAITAVAFPKSLLAERLGGEVFTNGSLGAYAQGILSQANFEAHMGSTFKAFLDNDEVAYLVLQAVTGTNSSSTISVRLLSRVNSIPALRRPTSNAPEITSFQLSFNTGGAVFSQGTYLLDSVTLGRFACFLVPGAEGHCGATFAYLPGSPLYVPGRPQLPPIALPGSGNPINLRSGPSRPVVASFD
jgi:hypothetical protein